MIDAHVIEIDKTRHLLCSTENYSRCVLNRMKNHVGFLADLHRTYYTVPFSRKPSSSSTNEKLVSIMEKLLAKNLLRRAVSLIFDSK